MRSLEGKLRIGLADKTLVVALAHAIVLKNLGKCLRTFPTSDSHQATKSCHMTHWQLGSKPAQR